MPTIDDAIIALMERVGELERRVSNSIRHGPVTDVDPKTQTCRVRLNPEAPAGQKDEPFKSAWIPYAQLAGEMKWHTPPVVGQNMTLLSPGGDPSQSIAVPFTWSDNFKSPGDKNDPHIMTYGDIKVTWQKDPSFLFIEVGKASIKIEKDKIIKLLADDLIDSTTTKGDITHNAKRNITGKAGSNIEGTAQKNNTQRAKGGTMGLYGKGVDTASDDGTTLEHGGNPLPPTTIEPVGQG